MKEKQRNKARKNEQESEKERVKRGVKKTREKQRETLRNKKNTNSKKINRILFFKNQTAKRKQNKPKNKEGLWPSEVPLRATSPDPLSPPKQTTTKNEKNTNNKEIRRV